MPAPSSQLREQIADLTQQIAALVQRIDRMEQRHMPFWFGWSRPAVEVSLDNPLNLMGVLRYHARSMRRGPMIYYALIGVLYFSAALSIVAGMSGLHVAHPWNLVLALGYFAVGVGNLSCMVITSARHQLRMVAPTIAAAALILVLHLVDATMPSQVITALIFWIPMMGGHLAWGLSIQGRVDQLHFTQQLLEAAQSRSALDAANGSPNPSTPSAPPLETQGNE